MKKLGLTLSTDHELLISGLKKAGILGKATLDIDHVLLLRHLNLNGYALRLRKDGKAYTLAKWSPGKDLARTLEQYVQGSENNIRVTIKR